MDLHNLTKELEQTLNAANQILAIWVRQGESVLAAHATCADWVGTPHSPFAETVAALIASTHPDDQHVLSECLQAEREQPCSLDTAVRIEAPSGDYRWAHLTTRHLGACGRYENVTIGLAFDVTEQRETLTALQENRKQFRLIAENTSDGLVVLDQGRIVYVSPSYTKQLGYSTEEEVGRTEESIVELIHPDDRKLTVSRIRDAISAGRDNLIYQFRVRRRDGTYVWREDHARFRYDGDGNYTGAFIICRDISERKANEEKIYQLAYFDPITGLPNRNYLVDYFEQLAPASKADYSAMALCDLDDFHLINDTKGHAAGDEILGLMADRLRAFASRCKAVCRMGGDEFLLVMQNLGPDKQEAEARANALIEGIHENLTQPFRLSGFGAEDFSLGLSTGYVLFRDHNESLPQLLRQAEIVLYTAKRSGKNRFQRFDSTLALELEHSVRRVKQLREGLANGELSLAFQPQVNQDGTLSGAEALLRWDRPGEGRIPPGEFIPLAEEAGLMVDVGLWVLESACATLAKWQRTSLSLLSLSLNISVSQFLQEDFEQTLIETVNRYGIKPERLKLEITESLLIDRPEKAEARIRNLQATGFRFSIDDFGTGYSALSYFISIPFDEVKIDQRFVRGIEPGSRSAAIVRTILELGHRLGIRVIAEGVETDHHQAQLASLGCEQFQGYLFSRPLSAVDFEDWVHDKLKPPA